MPSPAQDQPIAPEAATDDTPGADNTSGPDLDSDVEPRHVLHDGDSAISDLTSEDWTDSLSSSIRKYRHQFGRTYHAYKEGKYNVPNDEQEQERLDLQNHLFLLTLEGKLHRAPLGKIVHHCFDVGTGTGIWAINFAEEHPEAKVIGTDLSPIQPSWVSPNVEFLIDDVEEPWLFPDKFDYIHSRQMMGSIASWEKFFAYAYDGLKPGAWFELQDIGVLVPEDGQDISETGIMQWYETVAKAFEISGRDVKAGQHHAERLRAAGFVDVHDELYKWPLTPWPKDPKLKELGLWSRENILDCLEAWAIVPFTKFLGWTPEEVQVSLAKAQIDLKDPEMKIHASWKIHVVYGRKPDLVTTSGAPL